MRIKLCIAHHKPGIKRNPADTQAHGTKGFPKAQRAHDRHGTGRQANFPPASQHRGAMDLLQSSTRTRHSVGPALADSPPTHKPSRTAGLFAPLSTK